MGLGARGGRGVKVLKAKDGTPVAVAVRDRKRNPMNQGGLTTKERLRRKGLLGTIPPAERRLLTLRQREALQNFLAKGLDPSKKAECAAEAGYAPSNGGQAITNVLAKPFVRERIKEALEKAGVGYDRIAQIIAEGLEAEHPTADLRYDPETGEPYIPKDHTAIERYLRDAIDLHDLRPETKIRKQVDKRTVTIHLTAADDEALEKYRRMRKEAALEATVQDG